MAVTWRIGEGANTGRGRRANRSERIKLEPGPDLDLVVGKGLLARGHPPRARASRVNPPTPKLLPPCPQLYSSSMSPPLLRPNTPVLQIQEGGAQLLRPSQNPDSFPSRQLTGVRGGSAGGWDAWVPALAPACRGLTSGFGYGEEKGRRL